MAAVLTHGDTGQSPGSVEAEVMQIREDVRWTQRYANPIWMPRFDQIAATLTMRRGDYDAAIELIGSIIGDDLAAGITVAAGQGTTVLVEVYSAGSQATWRRPRPPSSDSAAEPSSQGSFPHELPLAHTCAPRRSPRHYASYVDHRDRYREMARRVDFKPHIAMARRTVTDPGIPSGDRFTRPPLAGVRIVEISSFVAVPLAGMTLAQLGAEVIRIDPIGGAADYQRWPLTDGG